MTKATNMQATTKVHRSAVECAYSGKGIRSPQAAQQTIEFLAYLRGRLGGFGQRCCALVNMIYAWHLLVARAARTVDGPAASQPSLNNPTVRPYGGCFKCRIGLGSPIPWFSSRKGSPQTHPNPFRAIASGAGYAGALANALAGSAVMLIQSSLEALDQARSGERLGQEANGSRLQCPGADTFFGEGCNKDKRR